MDFNVLKTLYEEILKTQALTEEQIKELREVLDSLSSVANATNNNTELFISILKKLDIIQKNIEVSGSEATKEAERAVEIIQKFINELQSNINRIKTSYKKTIEDIEYHQKKIIKDNKNAIDKAKSDIDDFCRYLDKKVTKEIELTKHKADKVLEEIEEKSIMNRWGAVLIAGAIGLIVGAGAVTFLKIDAIRSIARADLEELKNEYRKKVDKVDSYLFSGFYEKFIEPHNIKFVIEDGKKYIIVPIDKSVKAYENDNYRIIKLTTN